MIHTTHPSKFKPHVLLAVALFASHSTNALGGVAITETRIVSQPKKESNPLSFFDGKVVFDVEERFRWEIRNNNFDFNNDVNALTDDNWFLQRFRIGVGIKATSWLRIYAQGQDSREINSDRPDFPGLLGAEGDNTFDLRQGYIELGDAKQFPLTAKIGRQILSFGDERLVGAFDWNNIGRTFDAVKLRWEEKSWSLDAFASSVVVPERGSYNQSDFGNGNETDRGQIFSGLYFTTTALPFQATDLYVFHLHENTNARYFPAAPGDTNFATFGLRGKSKPGAFSPRRQTISDGKTVADGKSESDGKTSPTRLVVTQAVGLDFTYEFAFQTGELRGLDLTAFAAHADAGYTFDYAWRPRAALGYSFATGDNQAGDGDVETFQNLFPTNHKFYGQADFFPGKIYMTLSWI